MWVSGSGQGDFADKDGTDRTYHQGAVPQMRFGRMLGQHLMVSANYQAWIIEFDRSGDIVLEDAKIRRSLQDLTLGWRGSPGTRKVPGGDSTSGRQPGCRMGRHGDDPR